MERKASTQEMKSSIRGWAVLCSFLTEENLHSFISSFSVYNDESRILFYDYFQIYF